MIQELKNRDERIAAEIEDAFKRAREKAPDCDCILILMQRREGGLVWEAMPSMRAETVNYLATSFLHGFHGVTMKP